MNNLPEFSQATASLQPTLLLALYLIAGAYVIFSAVLYYHWHNYSTDQKVTHTTLITFFVCTFPLLLIMALILLTI